jgi:hypothetical protein
MGSFSIAAIGAIVVFITLILITYAIKLYSYILSPRKNNKKINPCSQSSGLHDINIANDDRNSKINQSNNCLKDVSSDEIVAVITAAIQAAYASIEVNTRIRVRSFRRISADTPVWKSAAWQEQLLQSRRQQRNI